MIRALFAAAAVVVAVGMAPPASADPVADLFGLLPAGYAEGVCHPVDVPRSQAERYGSLAALQCGPNSLPGGPTHARYVLHSDANGAGQAFQDYYNSSAWKAETCPGNRKPLPFPVSESEGKQLGLAACGRQSRDGGFPSIIWIHGVVCGNAAGSDFQSLMNWLGRSGAMGVGPRQ